MRIKFIDRFMLVEIHRTTIGSRHVAADQQASRSSRALPREWRDLSNRWIVFRENADPRMVLGMALIVAGAVVLGVPDAAHGASMGWNALLIASACLCWVRDNNFTRKVSASDALFIAGLKGLTAGIINVGIALVLGARWPVMSFVGTAMTVGLLGYGVSLVLSVLALRGLGSARTAAYFSTAPFLGAAIAILAFGDHASPMFWLAAGLMGAGVWLHLTERHEAPAPTSR